MIVCRNKSSKKFFIYLKEIDWDNIKVVTPLSQIKTLERILFEDEIEGPESELIGKKLITENQHKIYRDYIRHRKTHDFEKDSHETINQEDSASSDSKKIISAEGKAMKNIEIDDEVYAYLQSKAVPFQEKNPNDVIRRLLGIKSKPVKVVSTPPPTNLNGSKAPQANILKLVELGKLKEGQTLSFSYKGRSLSKKYTAKIVGNKLNYQDELFTMSGLVDFILENEGMGIPSRRYRGPIYWFTADGISVSQLWRQYLKEVHDA